MILFMNSPLKVNKFFVRMAGHIWKFMISHGLVNSRGEYLVALSGGVDSVALIYMMRYFLDKGWINRVRAVHIHHNSRTGQDSEMKFVQSLCQQLGVEVSVQKLDWGLSDQSSDFENKARNLRYNFFLKELGEGEGLVLGHHIDDSYEWSLLQSSRSADLISSLGIPVRRGPIIRPFMCVTKQHLLNLATSNQIAFIEDPTNFDLKHERNALRVQVIENLKQRHPQYLKHYVHRSNELARSLGVHISEKKGSAVDYKIINYSHGKLLLHRSYQNDFTGCQSIIKQLITELSEGDRGSLSKEVDKIINALKSKKEGPFFLSGGVKAVLLSYGILLFNTPIKISKLDFPIGDFESYELSDFIHEVECKLEESNLYDFPLWVLVKSSKGIRKDIPHRRRDHTFWNIEAKQSDEVGHLVCSFDLIQRWSQRKNLMGRSLEIQILW